MLYGISQSILNHRDADVYVSSFCESDDLLSQWRGYGNRGGGYSIGFDIKTSIIKADDNAYGIFKIIYKREEQEKLVNSVLDDIISSLVSTQPNGGYDIGMGKHPIYQVHWDAANLNLRLVAMRFKDKGFEQEQEWRFYARSPLGETEHVQFRDSNGILVPYLKLPLKRDCVEIKAVRSGPSLRPHLAQTSAQMLLNKYKLNHVKAERSSIPFSGS